MKSYKKIIVSIILCLSLILSFAGCVIDNGEETEDGTADINVENQDNGEEKTEEKPLATIEQTVCLEEMGVKVTANKISEEKISGETLEFTIENNSTEVYNVSIAKVIINNCMTSASESEKVAAGKKVNTKIYIKTDELKAAGIDNVGQFELYFRISDPDTYDTLYESKTPFILKTSYFDEMDTEPDDSGKEIYNDKGLRIVAKEVDENSFWGKALVLFIENTSEKNYTVSARDISVNGYMVDEHMLKEINAGKFIIANLEIFGSSLEENNIEKIEDIELKFEFYPDDDFMDRVKTDPIKLTME